MPPIFDVEGATCTVLTAVAVVSVIYASYLVLIKRNGHDIENKTCGDASFLEGQPLMDDNILVRDCFDMEGSFDHAELGDVQGNGNSLNSTFSDDINFVPLKLKTWLSSQKNQDIANLSTLHDDMSNSCNTNNTHGNTSPLSSRNELRQPLRTNDEPYFFPVLKESIVWWELWLKEAQTTKRLARVSCSFGTESSKIFCRSSSMSSAIV